MGPWAGVWDAGLTFQLNVMVELAPLAESVAVTVTEVGPAAVIVPEMTPAAGSIVRPAGRPLAEYTTVGALLVEPTEMDTWSPTELVWSPGLVKLTAAGLLVWVPEPVSVDVGDVVTVTVGLPLGSGMTTVVTCVVEGTQRSSRRSTVRG
jgi:hypothetical protein